jgi:hypothetical protein
LGARLPKRWPARALLGVGLLLVGVGLLLMHGVEVGDSWTGLLPGFLVAGVGIGLTNPAIASTALGVVPPARAGMASGINSTFRQVGIAAFGDFALADGSFSKPPENLGHRFAGDAGIGIRASHRIGTTQFVTRFDMPLYVGFEYLAHDQVPGKHVAWRWTFSFQPPF